jgi:histidinol-phosphate phosphatase family protein
MSERKAVFLDRDGTLIIDMIYLNDPEKIVYLPNVFEALRLLSDDGYVFVVVTNQSGMARGIVDIKNLDEIHRRMTATFAREGVFFEGFYYAPYSVESNHWMRKPNPGMLEAGARDHGLDLKKSWMIGDRLTDVDAGVAAACRTILLKGVEEDLTKAKNQPDGFFGDLLESAKFILQHDRKLKA